MQFDVLRRKMFDRSITAEWCFRPDGFARQAAGEQATSQLRKFTALPTMEPSKIHIVYVILRAQIKFTKG